MNGPIHAFPNTPRRPRFAHAAILLRHAVYIISLIYMRASSIGFYRKSYTIQSLLQFILYPLLGTSRPSGRFIVCGSTVVVRGGVDCGSLAAVRGEQFVDCVLVTVLASGCGFSGILKLHDNGMRVGIYRWAVLLMARRF